MGRRGKGSKSTHTEEKRQKQPVADDLYCNVQYVVSSLEKQLERHLSHPVINADIYRMIVGSDSACVENCSIKVCD